MLRRAAKQAARDAKKWNIPVRHLTVKQVREGAKGFCGHYDITRAFPEDNGSHTDPGANFPWSRFLEMVRAELNPEPAKPAQPPEEIEVAFQDEKIKATATTGAELFEPDLAAGTEVNASTVLQLAAIHARRAALDAAASKVRLAALETELADAKAQLAEILAAVKPTQG
jgi:hypothetical protein